MAAPENSTLAEWRATTTPTLSLNLSASPTLTWMPVGRGAAGWTTGTTGTGTATGTAGRSTGAGADAGVSATGVTRAGMTLRGARGAGVTRRSSDGGGWRSRRTTSASGVTGARAGTTIFGIFRPEWAGTTGIQRIRAAAQRIPAATEP